MNKKKLKIEVSARGTKDSKDNSESKSRSRVYSKGKDRQDWHNDEKKPYVGPNDIKWRDCGALTRAAANVPFGTPAGLEMPVVENDYNGNFTRTTAIVPGILNVEGVLTVGASVDYNSPFNLVTRKSYSFIRHANSGSKVYEAVDLGMYYNAVGQALALHGWLKRIYTFALTFSATNRYLPAKILQAMHVDYDDIKSHLPQLLFLITWLGNSIGSLAFPKMPFFDYASEVFMRIYSDSDSPKEQIYMLSPVKFGRFDPTMTGGGGVEYDVTIPSTVTFAVLESIVNTVMNVLLSDEDIGIISGDVLKAYGEDRYIPQSVDAHDIATPVHSIEMLQQIHNLETGAYTITRYSQATSGTNTGAYAFSNYVLSDTIADASSDLNPINRRFVVDANTAHPDPLEVVNCTALKAGAVIASAVFSSPNWTINYDPSGFTHDIFLPVRVEMTTDLVNSIGSAMLFAHNFAFDANFGGTIGFGVSAAAYLPAFDWHPIIVAKDTNDYVCLFGELYNTTTIDITTLKRIQEASILAMFGFTGPSVK